MFAFVILISIKYIQAIGAFHTLIIVHPAIVAIKLSHTLAIISYAYSAQTDYTIE